MKRQAAGLDVVGDQLLETGLEDRDPAGVQRLDLARVLVDADHVMAEIGKADPGHKTDITRTDHGDVHETSFLLLAAGSASERDPVFGDCLRLYTGSPVTPIRDGAYPGGCDRSVIKTVPALTGIVSTGRAACLPTEAC